MCTVEHEMIWLSLVISLSFRRFEGCRVSEAALFVNQWQKHKHHGRTAVVLRYMNGLQWGFPMDLGRSSKLPHEFQRKKTWMNTSNDKNTTLL